MLWKQLCLFSYLTWFRSISVFAALWTPQPLSIECLTSSLVYPTENPFINKNCSTTFNWICCFINGQIDLRISFVYKQNQNANGSTKTKINAFNAINYCVCCLFCHLQRIEVFFCDDIPSKQNTISWWLSTWSKSFVHLNYFTHSKIQFPDFELCRAHFKLWPIKQIFLVKVKTVATALRKHWLFLDKTKLRTFNQSFSMKCKLHWRNLCNFVAITCFSLSTLNFIRVIRRDTNN